MKSTVDLKSCARLHFGLLQVPDAYPRRNLGLCAALETLSWHLRVQPTLGPRRLTITRGSDLLPSRTRQVAQSSVTRCQTASSMRIGLAVEVFDGLPEHVDLGSPTSFLRGLWAAYGLLTTGKHDAVPLRAWHRGGTSGIWRQFGQQRADDCQDFACISRNNWKLKSACFLNHNGRLSQPSQR
jgi:hypothetical protein